MALPARYTAASREAAAILLVSRAALVEQHIAVLRLSARSGGADVATYMRSASPGAPAVPDSLRTGPPANRGRAGTSHRSWRRLIIVAVAAALTMAVSAATIITVLALRHKQSPTTGPANHPAPAAASPSTSPVPTPSLSPSPTPSPSASASTPASLSAETPGLAAVPKAYIGAWEGEFTEPGERSPSLRRIVLHAGTVGTTVANVLTLSRNSLCQNQGTASSAGALLVITPGPATAPSTGPCNQTGDIVLRSKDNDTLTWKSDGITTTLHRAASADRAVPAQFLGTWRAQDGNDPTSSVRMTVLQGPIGQARAEFAWEGDAHHCKGVSVLAFTGGVLKFGPEAVTASEPAGFCTQTPSRIVSAPQGNTMHIEWFTPPDGSQPRAFDFSPTG
ncbi:hypothetical protein ACIA6D_41815 [Streptomyces cacaoi]